MSHTGFQNKRAIPLIALFILLISPIPSFARVFKKTSVLMGTDIELTASDSDESRVNTAFNAALHEIDRIENEMSEWKDGTPLSIINQKAGKEAVPVPEELFNVLLAAQKISELSEGAFDVSWASMRGVWNFSKGMEHVPSAEDVSEKLSLVNYKDIELDGIKKTVFLKRPGMAIGLGAIAKGYAVDRAMQALVNSGIKNAIVKAGGDMRVQGTDDGKPWEIGIQHPRNREKLLGKLALSNISISTSGDYERFFIKDNILYHHIMNPKTGYPARGCQSVTILAPDTMTSDALSTAVFVLGPEEGMQLIKSLPGIEGIIVDSNGDVLHSPGIYLH
ncbi:MAG: FAD:protein FMN transferase [Nitrospirae bacterium]|nr:FAD:protein FMN transferase [Nitrospirota bacterium]